MIHKNRGNRRWMDKRKRRSKYNLCQRIWGDAMYFLDGILGKYDKGKIHDIDHAEKTNGKTSQKGGRDNILFIEWVIIILILIKRKLKVVMISLNIIQVVNKSMMN